MRSIGSADDGCDVVVWSGTRATDDLSVTIRVGTRGSGC